MLTIKDHAWHNQGDKPDCYKAAEAQRDEKREALDAALYGGDRWAIQAAIAEFEAACEYMGAMKVLRAQDLEAALAADPE